MVWAGLGPACTPCSMPGSQFPSMLAAGVPRVVGVMLPECQGCSGLGAGPSTASPKEVESRGDPAPAPGHRQREAAGLAGGSDAVRRGPFLPVCKPVPQPSALGAFPTAPRSSIAAHLPRHPPALTRTGRMRQESRHGAGRRADLLPLLSCHRTLSTSPPCSPPPLDASWLPVYEEDQEAVDFIQAFVNSPGKVTAALSKAAVPAPAGRGSAACCRAAGGVLPGQSCFSQVSHTALHPECSGPAVRASPPLTPPVSLSLFPRLPGGGPEDEVP